MLGVKNWKTTFAGILAIVFAGGDAALKIVNNAPVDLNTTLATILAGIGLITAKDKNVTGGTVKQ